MAGEELLFGGLEDKLGKIAEVVEDKAAEEVTSSVYTDEGGREQSLVSKSVYQTDESSQSNIIIQEVQQQVEGKKLVRIDLSNMEGYMMAGQGKEEEELRLEEELEGREARLEEELDLQAAEQGEEEGRKVEEVARPVVASLQGFIQTTGISSIPHLGLALVAAPGERAAEMLKILYKEYGQRILAAEIRPLLSKAELCDTVLVCRWAGDGSRAGDRDGGATYWY